ncbi:MAG: hypothetical protein K0S44_933 [Bacteroidetes bacterium]|jgi:hypothetical protein|nr:hypothetical protein [Bacteroidota bacterium]
MKQKFITEAISKIQHLKCINPECKIKTSSAKDVVVFSESQKGVIVKFKKEKICCEVYEVIVKQAINNILPKG